MSDEKLPVTSEDNDVVLDDTPEDDTPTEKRVRVMRHKARALAVVSMLATGAGMYFGKIEPYAGCIALISQLYVVWVGDEAPFLKTMLKALMIGSIPLLAGLAGCGLHLVKYDPDKVAEIADAIREDHKTYRENVPTPTADVQILGEKIDENLGKQAELLRTK